MLSRRDYDLLVLYREERPWPEDEKDEDRFRSLRDRKLVDAVSFEPSSGDGWFAVMADNYRVTPAGEDALSEYEQSEAERREKSAKDAADKKAEHGFQIRLVLLTALVTILGTLFVEHFMGIVKFLGGLLG